MKVAYRSAVLVFLIVLMLGLILPANAAVAAGNGVFTRQDTKVPHGQSVEDVVTVGADVTIGGTVNNYVIAINGDVTLQSTARVDGMLVVIGGRIRQEAGAQTNDVIVNLSFDEPVLNSLLIGGGMVAGLWLLQLAASLLCVVLPPLLVLVLRERTVGIERQLRAAPGRLIGIGFLGGVLLLAVAALLALTIVGLPFTLLLLLLAAAAFVLGLTAVSSEIGARFHNGGRAPWAVALIGSSIVTAGLNVPVLGVLFGLGLLWTGLGLSILLVRERKRNRVHK